jgi:hypothetical protein
MQQFKEAEGEIILFLIEGDLSKINSSEYFICILKQE